MTDRQKTWQDVLATKPLDANATQPLRGKRDSEQHQQHMITLDGTQVPYRVRVSPRARRLRLVIRPELGLEVVAPPGTSAARIEHVLRDKDTWITRTLARVADELAGSYTPITHGQVLPYVGRHLYLALMLGTPTHRYRAYLSGDTLTLTVADSRQETTRTALETWYRRQARTVFAERLAHCNATYGFQHGRVSIKDQKSRWGSCSREGNLNFNWRLLLAPLPVLDYVVYHELAHLKVLNHSPRFWSLLAHACPDYETHRRWLRQHGRTLHL